MNRCRIGEISDDDINLLESRHVDKFEDYPKESIHLFAENVPCAEYNKVMLQEIMNKSYVIEAIDKVPKGVNLSSLIKNQSQMQTRGLAKTLELKVGALVMITQNIDVADKLVNGQIGTVFQVHIGHCGRADIIYLKFNSKDVGLKAKRCNEFAMKNNCIPIKEEESVIIIGKNLSFTRQQFPLMLSYAVTVHKVQGIQIPSGVISFELLMQRGFNAGQLYVALSRVESLDGLYVSGKFRKKAIHADKFALREYERLRTEASIVPIQRFALVPTNFIISLLNVRSLQSHIADIDCDFILRNCDLFLFTETQIGMDSDISNTYLKDFSIAFHNDEDKFKSLAVGYRNGIDLQILDADMGFMVFSVCKQTFSALTIKGVLIYKKNNMSANNFVCLLNHIFSLHGDIDIILGDINLDGYMLPNIVSNVLDEFDQVVNDATQLSGKMLDQIFVKKNITFQVETLVKNVYFSDHDAVICQLKRK